MGLGGRLGLQSASSDDRGAIDDVDVDVDSRVMDMKWVVCR